MPWLTALRNWSTRILLLAAATGLSAWIAARTDSAARDVTVAAPVLFARAFPVNDSYPVLVY
jgi:hypothetical protein